VVIPAHNSAKTLSECLNSVLAQTFLPSEIIVVLDDCLDDSRDILESFSDTRLKVFEVKYRSSAKSRNYGVQKSSSEIIAFLDADDIWMPEKIESQLSIHRSKNEILATYSIFVNIHKAKLGRNIRSKSDQEARDMILLGQGLPAMLSTWVMSRSLFLSLNGFNENLPAAEDFDFISRAIHLGVDIRIIRKDLSEYLIHANSKSMLKRVAQRRIGKLITKNQGKRIEKDQVEDLTKSKVGLFELKSLYSDLALRRFMLTAKPQIMKRKYYLLVIALLLNPKRFLQKLRRQAM